jgi:putative peptide zinc metalloprotease protein
MSDQTKLVALPAYLPRRLQAFRVVRGSETSYVLRDKLANKTHDLQQWQFFVLEVLPGCETADKLLSVFSDRFGREISEQEVMTLFAHLADNKLLDEESAKHPLLKPFTRTGYALEQGLIKPKSFEELALKMAAGSGKASGPAAAPDLAPRWPKRWTLRSRKTCPPASMRPTTSIRGSRGCCCGCSRCSRWPAGCCRCWSR